MDQLRQDMAIANKYRYIEEGLKKYGLLKPENHSFEKIHLNLTHMDIDMPEGSTYSERVSTWFDFIATMHVDNDLEPMFMFNEAIPNVRTLAIMLKGVNRCACSVCNGKGQVPTQGTMFNLVTCPECLGLGVE